VEAEIQKGMGEALFHAFYTRHCGRGIRRDCPCTFCSAKRRGTAYISFTRFPYARWQDRISNLKAAYALGVHDSPEAYWDYFDDLRKDLMKEVRQEKQIEVRRELDEQKRNYI
jgi:hypothetical protein